MASLFLFVLLLVILMIGFFVVFPEMLELAHSWQYRLGPFPF